MMKKTLKELRLERGMTQPEVADAIGIDPRTYRKYENGESDMNGDKLQKSAKVLGVPSDDIILVRKKRVK